MAKNKYFCAKCEQFATDKGLVKSCSKCKYSLTNITADGAKYCLPYADLSEYTANYQKIAGVNMCEGAFHDPLSNMSKCFMCSEGYSLRQWDFNGTTNSSCVKTNIAGCIVSETNRGKEKCYVCKRRYPNADLSACVSSATDLDKNCLFGTRHPSVNDNQPFCALCMNGFALYPKKDSQGRKTYVCSETAGETDVATTKCPFGCARCNENNICQWCNHYSGFYMTDLNACTQTSNKFKLSWILGFISVILAIFA